MYFSNISFMDIKDLINEIKERKLENIKYVKYMGFASRQRLNLNHILLNYQKDIERLSDLIKKDNK